MIYYNCIDTNVEGKAMGSAIKPEDIGIELERSGENPL